MSLMHDALKEMDKPRSEAGVAAAAATASAGAPTPAPRSRQDDTVPPTGMTALDWQVAKFNADARANAHTAMSSEGESSKLNVSLIAWVLGGVLCVILAALWFVQSRQGQQTLPATEGIAALTPPPKTVSAVQPAQVEVAIPAVVEPSAASTVVATEVAVTSPPTAVPIAAAGASRLASSAIAAAPVLVSGAATTVVPLSANPVASPVTMSIAPATAKLVAAASASATSLPITQPAALKAQVASVAPVQPLIAGVPRVAARMEVVAKDAPRDMSRPRTAILSTTTLPAPPVAEVSTPVVEPNAIVENKLANAALASTPVAAVIAPPVIPIAAAVAQAPKQPQLSAKQLAAQAAVAAAETKRKEALAQQTATARVAASQNASTRYAAIGRALDAGDRAAAQSQLSSLEQELPASSLTLLRARAWVVGTGSDMAAARGAYAAILARLPEDENALLNMAALEAKDGKMDVARTYLAQALSANPESAAAKAAQQRISALTAQPR